VRVYDIKVAERVKASFRAATVGSGVAHMLN